MSANKEAVVNTQETIRAFIKENFYVPEDAGLEDTTSLIESGIVDSTGVLEIVAFLEKEFSLTVPDGDIVPANLDSIARIAAYVAHVVAASAPATFNARGAVAVSPRT